LSWSTGKDSAWTLYKLFQSKKYQVTTLFTTVNQKQDRVAMHSTRSSILSVQAKSLGLHLEIVEIPEPCSNIEYESAMKNLIEKSKIFGIKKMAFGDLFLTDIRQYRESQLKQKNIEGLFPLWGQDTKLLANEMIDGGLKAIITCVDTSQLSENFLGREFDKSLLDDLPDSVDFCGENGEFHTCVYDLPMFSKPINFKLGKKHVSGQFHFIDVSLF
jgi:uncharacterized protein (TIGR00290 family)